MTAEEITVEKRYWMRVWIVASGIALGWRNLPDIWDEHRDDIIEGLISLWWLLVKAAMPLFFWLAPLWLYLIDRHNAKVKAAREQAAAEYLASIQPRDSDRS